MRKSYIQSAVIVAMLGAILVLGFQTHEDNYVPPETPSVEEELEWDCGPLLDEFDLILEPCEDNADLVYHQCRIELVKKGWIGLLEDMLERCEGNKDVAIKQCAIDDQRRRGTLPPECGQ